MKKLSMFQITLLVVFGVGDWMACTLLRLHILKLQEKQA